MSHKPRKPLEERTLTDFNAMQKIAEGIGATVNRMFGGYLRQAIRTEQTSQSTYYITGYCVLNNAKCGYTAPRGKLDACENCAVYHQYVTTR